MCSPTGAFDRVFIRPSSLTQVRACIRLTSYEDSRAVSACSSQNRMSISLYILVARVNCSCASCRLPVRP